MLSTPTVNTGAAPNPLPGDFIALRRGTGTYSEADGINLRGEPQALAEYILTAHGKGTDDALVVVARYMGAGAP